VAGVLNTGRSPLANGFVTTRLASRQGPHGRILGALPNGHPDQQFVRASGLRNAGEIPFCATTPPTAVGPRFLGPHVQLRRRGWAHGLSSAHFEGNGSADCDLFNSPISAPAPSIRTSSVRSDQERRLPQTGRNGSFGSERKHQPRVSASFLCPVWGSNLNSRVP